MSARRVALTLVLLLAPSAAAAPNALAVAGKGPDELSTVTVVFRGEFGFGFDAFPGADGVGLCEPGMDPYADCAVTPGFFARYTDAAIDAPDGSIGSLCTAAGTIVPAGTTCDLRVRGSVDFPETGPTCAAFEGQLAGALRIGDRTGDLIVTVTALAGGGAVLMGGYVVGEERYAVAGHASLWPTAAEDCAVEPATSFSAVGVVSMVGPLD